jgi:hypothetical protein
MKIRIEKRKRRKGDKEAIKIENEVRTGRKKNKKGSKRGKKDKIGKEIKIKKEI